MDGREIFIVVEGIRRACLLSVLLVPVPIPLRARVGEKIAGIAAVAAAAASIADATDLGAVLVCSTSGLPLALDCPRTGTCSSGFVGSPPERREGGFRSHLLIFFYELQGVRKWLRRLVRPGKQSIGLCLRQGRQGGWKTITLALRK